MCSAFYIKMQALLSQVSVSDEVFEGSTMMRKGYLLLLLSAYLMQ